MTNEYRDPGHPVLDPTGNAIRLPSRRSSNYGGLAFSRSAAVFRKSPQQSIRLMTSEYDGLTDGLRRLLGEDCTEPNG